MVTIRSVSGSPCHINYGGKELALEIKKGESVQLDGDLNKL